MFPVHASKIFAALFAVVLCAGVAYAQTSPLTSDHASVTVTFQKPSTAGSAVTVKISATSSTYFTVDPASVPFWLSLDAMNGTAVTAGVNIAFTPNSTGSALSAGSFGGSVHFKVTGFSDLVVPVTLVVANPASTLSVAEGTTQTINWAQGSAYPTSTLTMVSDGSPINFTVAPSITAPTTPANWLKVNHTSGVAYIWGTPITVTFVQAVFDNANVGDDLTGTVTVTPAVGSVVAVAYTIHVTSPAAAITRIFPAETPVQATATSTDPPLTVVVTGSGFVATPSDKKTVVTIGSSTLDTSAVNVVSPTTMLLTITPDNFNTAASLSIGAQNPSVSSPSTTTLNVTGNPIIYAVTDGASLVEAAPGSSPSFAPYEMISIFGDNFGPTTTAVTATLDSFSRYPNQLTANSHTLTVSFYRADGTTLIANAYLLFASQTQINAMVPSGVTGQASVKIAVTYNSNSSTQYAANVVTASPGIFTATSSGTGQGAILHADFSANSTSNKAAKGSTVLLYVSGLGAPNSTAANTASTTAPTFPAGCISAANYMGTINAATTHPSPAWTTVDGVVILSSKLATNHFPPCFASPVTVTVTIDGKAATVSYAGWVADSIDGLYQVNAVVPTTATSGNAISVQVAVGTAKSQSGVTMAIQ